MAKKKSKPEVKLELAGPAATAKHETNAINSRDRFRSLVDIGIAISSEKEISKILDLILSKAVETTEADAASIFLTENIRIDSIATSTSQKKYFQVLRFHRSTDRRAGPRIQNKVLDIDKASVAGYVVSTGETVRIEDCYKLTGQEPFKFNSNVDKETDYRTVSLLAIPLKNADGKIRGVIQLLNKTAPHAKRARAAAGEIAPKPDTKDILPFSDEDEELMHAFASQATAALENAKLTEDIGNLFESFIRASVTAIEARDPATSGHSDRVAVLTVEFARAVHQCPTGLYGGTLFSDEQIRELRYAALLHDFGKIGVRESVLSKSHKLYPHQMETILLRLDSARARQEMMQWKDMATDLVTQFEKGIIHEPRAKLADVSKRIDAFAQQLQQVRLSIIKANQPQIMDDDFDIASLMSWINKTSRELDHALVTPEEMIKLSLPKGSLSEEERREIESHVSHTYHFLRQIAWTEDLANVADIAHAHHEKCDGTGYPRGLVAEHIPVQAKMMSISDIYDALTSMDRPYKRAVSAERAIEILHLEARNGKLDLDLLKIFVEADVFRTADGMRNRKTA
ncbi:MAG: GAF domain-containing protein [Proteobacteria bacterium]|nr:MAG: GAF domain-containing protein [Pseudomonadota bacterium]